MPTVERPMGYRRRFPPPKPKPPRAHRPMGRQDRRQASTAFDGQPAATSTPHLTKGGGASTGPR
eukprot:4550056-Prymnesium_polylepis.1